MLRDRSRRVEQQVLLPGRSQIPNLAHSLGHVSSRSQMCHKSREFDFLAVLSRGRYAAISLPGKREPRNPCNLDGRAFYRCRKNAHQVERSPGKPPPDWRHCGEKVVTSGIQTLKPYSFHATHWWKSLSPRNHTLANQETLIPIQERRDQTAAALPDAPRTRTAAERGRGDSRATESTDSRLRSLRIATWL